MFSKATRLKIRFQTTSGFLTVEDLWDLPLSKLNIIAKNLNKQLKTQKDEEDFLDEKSAEDTETKLKFDIVLSILETKKAENKEASESSEKKLYNQKILALIAAKQEDDLKSKSVDELQALLKQ